MLQNASEAAPPGSAVDLRVAAPGGALAVEVGNEGAVGDPDQMFEPFYTTKTDRLGLGLAIARRARWGPAGGPLTATSERRPGDGPAPAAPRPPPPRPAPPHA